MFLKFLRDCRGSVLPTFAIVAVPLIVATGAVVDYTNAFHQRTLVQDAMDAAALAAGKQVGIMTTAQIKVEAQNFFTANITGKYIAEYPPLNATVTGATVDLTTTLHVPTYFLGLIGLNQFVFNLAAQVTSGIGTLEVALVLDNSGSMSGSKISTLKTASTNLVNTLFNLGATSTKPDPVKMAVIPFAASVNVGSQYASATWMDTAGKGTYHAYEMKCYANGGTLNSSGACSVNVGTAINNFNLFKYLKDSSGNAVAWGGCVEERAMPYDTTDDPPATAANPTAEQAKTLFVPMIAPDEPDNWTSTSSCTATQKVGSGSGLRYNCALTGSQSYNNYLPDAGDATSCVGTTFTVGSAANPAVITSNAHGLAAGREIQFWTTGSLPTGLTAGTIYYVAASGLATNTFRVTTTTTKPTFTVTKASPAIFTSNGHGLTAGTPVVFSTTGALYTGLTAGTTYYVISAGLTTNAFEVSASVGGGAVNTSGSQSGTHTFERLVAASGTQSGTQTYTLPSNWTCSNGNANCDGTNVGKAEAAGFAGTNVSSSPQCKYGTGISNKGTMSTITVGGIPGGPNFMCTTPPITPLTPTKATVTTAINNLVAQGATSIAAGTGWGFRLLSPNVPFTEGRSFSDPDNKKILVIETDGDNTYYPNSKAIGKSWYDTYGYVARGQLGTTSTTASTWTTYMDARTRQACDNAKAKGIIVYTIGFEITASTVGNVNNALALLQYCASDPDKYFNAQDSTQLLAAFTAIGDSITLLRVSK
jgi:Flp pilus assembly protein TadG